jgi:WD repeat-containing protein 55
MFGKIHTQALLIGSSSYCRQDVAFHPTQPLLASGIIDGSLVLHSCQRDATTRRHSCRAHEEHHPSRAVQFSLSGDVVYSASTDKSILAVDVATGKPKTRNTDAHEAAVSRLAGISESMIASGDENGVVKLWDERQRDVAVTLEPHSDYVSDMYWQEQNNALLTCSGDGTLAFIDVRARRIKAESEGDADDELLSVVGMKSGRKVVCGTTSGVLAVWSWGHWEDCSDRFPGHPESVTSMVKFDEDTLLTASSDGVIRILQVHPNRLLGVLGEHGQFDIERLAANGEKSLLASASHDNSVKVWDLSLLADDGDNDEQEESEQGGERGGEEEDRVKAEDEHQQVLEGAGGATDSDDSDDHEAGPRSKRKKRGQGRGEHRITNKKQQKSNNFFSDLL